MNIHIIAIGGSVMHQLAICLQQNGNTVSGSDDEIFDPALTQLAQHGLLPTREGWFAEKINKQLNAVIVGMHAKPNNPELIAAQQLQLPIYSYPEYIFQQSINKQRVVIAGSHGKTTITSMVMHVLQQLNYCFDYLVGAKLPGFNNSLSINNNNPTIIIEGDEYLASPIHPFPKIFYYKPKIALISGIAFDHINVFPTFNDYVQQFYTFVEKIDAGNTLIYNAQDPEVAKVAEWAKHLNCIPYLTPHYQIKNDTFFINNHAQQPIALKIFGQHNMQNLAGAKLICNQLGIADQQFYTAIQSFSGAAKRLELIDKNTSTAFYRDFAHAPSKVKATVQAMKDMYPNRQLIACLELHTYSSLNIAFLPNYKHTLNAATTALVFFNQHTLAIKNLPFLNPMQIAQFFEHPNLQVFTQKEELEQYLKNNNWQQKNALFMSSGTFDGLNLKDIINFAVV